MDECEKALPLRPSPKPEHNQKNIKTLLDLFDLRDTLIVNGIHLQPFVREEGVAA